MWVQDQKKYPEDFEYFYYEGSLTSPQCDEGVFWYVISDPFEIGNAYITMISEALNDLPELTEDSSIDQNIYKNPNNDGTYRNVQKLNKRQIFFHAVCDGQKKEENKNGHFESLTEDVTHYYFTSKSPMWGLEGAEKITPEEAYPPKKDEEDEGEGDEEHHEKKKRRMIRKKKN